MNCKTCFVILAAALAFAAAGCKDRTAAPSPTGPSPTAAPGSAAPTAEKWRGKWNGPEGTFLQITNSNGQFGITIQNLDGPRTFVGTAVGDRLEFERDGVRESVRASDGAQTGMKWLSEKKDCLTVKAGEGYCRD